MDETALLEEVKQWIDEHGVHFKRNGKILYDEENLKRIKRFINSPDKYLEERFELNKEVLKNYHKLHYLIFLAGFTSFYLLVVTNFLKTVVEKYQDITLNTFTFNVKNISLVNVLIIFLLLVGPIIAIKIRLTYQILKLTGLLRVILDAEIEVYYISKIMELRDKNRRKEAESPD